MEGARRATGVSAKNRQDGSAGVEAGFRSARIAAHRGGLLRRSNPSIQRVRFLPFESVFPIAGTAARRGTGKGWAFTSHRAISLNNYLPTLRPGHYRAAVLARKLVLTSRTPMSATYGYANPPQYAVSNAIEFEVSAASPAWVDQAIAASVANLKGPQPNSREAYESRRASAEQLRFLDHMPAWEASLNLLPVEENILLRGLGL